MNKQNMHNTCKMFMQDADLVYVSTIDENGYPQTRAMFNLKNLRRFGRLAAFFNQQENIFVTYLATNKNSVKMKQLGNNPKACLYYSSLTELHGLALIGEIEVVEDAEIRKTLWQEDWAQFFQGGLDGPNYTVLKVKPVQARGVYKRDSYEFTITY